MTQQNAFYHVPIRNFKLNYQNDIHRFWQRRARWVTNQLQ